MILNDTTLAVLKTARELDELSDGLVRYYRVAHLLIIPFKDSEIRISKRECRHEFNCSSGLIGVSRISYERAIVLAIKNTLKQDK